MNSKCKKLLSFLLAFLILPETFVSPVAAAETAEEQTDQATASITEVAEFSTKQENPEVVGELKELRTENTKQFRLSDGSIALVQYETDVHYQDEEGSWQQIDNSLTGAEAEDSSDASGYATAEGKSAFKFAKNPNANCLSAEYFRWKRP